MSKKLLFVCLMALILWICAIPFAGATNTSGTVTAVPTNSGAYTVFTCNMTADASGNVTATNIFSGVGELIAIETCPGTTNPTTGTYALIVKDKLGYALTQSLTGACSASAAEFWYPKITSGDGATTSPSTVRYIPVIGGVDAAITGMKPSSTVVNKFFFRKL